ncbi:MAG: DUF885 domain-containing protein [Xanthomonadales bacterium PRO6]|nr:hypothetical protein [Xanthomonadales bacterium]MCE7932569.1 DUF885 domain-containing protein [Xanthomonadales bacterium PRO6]
MGRSLAMIALASWLGACAAPEPAPDAGIGTQAGPPGRAAQLDAIYDAWFERNLALNPLEATQIGDARYNDQLPNTLAPEWRESTRRLHQEFLDRAKSIGAAGLGAQDLLSYELFVHQLERELETLRYPRHLVPLNQFYSFASSFAVLGSGTSAQPFAGVADHDAWLRRARRIPAIFDQAIANMREGIAAGITQPRVLMQKVLPQLDAQIVDEVERSSYWGPVARMPDSFPAAERERLQREYRALIAEQLVPAYRRLREFVAAEYLPAARTSVGLGALPDGAQWYAFQVRRSTTTALTPDEIHAIGLDEVARLQQEMRAVQRELGVDGSLQDFYRAMKAEPRNYYASEDELLAAYRGFRVTIEPRLPALFDIRPKADFEIRAVESFRAASASAASYQAPSEDGSRLGIFYVNTHDLKARPRWALEALYLHEATPGHHFQIALQRELTGLPRFRRFSGEIAFSEGWGLYAESLGPELGVYTDPVMRFGALDAELWRAIRLVADTGIHARGWTRQHVLDYMYANSPAEPTRAVSEAERFMAIPGQALAYKIGQLRIRALRTRAEQVLGPRFDLRAFHREVLVDGSLPLDVLEAKIDRWIAAQG